MWEELGQSLSRLAGGQGEGLWVPLGHRPRSQIEAEAADAIAVVVQAHAVLGDSPARGGHKPYARASIVRAVAHTMRLLLHLGRWRDAHELDRAFFSPDKASAPITNLRQQTIHQLPPSTSSPPRLSRQPFAALDGVNLARGSSQQAWLTSLALRLRADAYPSLADFLTLLAQFRAQLGQQVRSHISQFSLACLARMGPFLGQRMEAEGVVRPGRGDATVLRLLGNLPGHGQAARTPMVVKAVAETHLERLEAAEAFGVAEWQRWQDLTELAARLMDDDAEEDHGKAASSVGDGLGSLATADEEQTVERQAERLHVAIRTLLLQARLKDPAISNAPEAARLPPAAKSIAAARELHSRLNGLTPAALPAPAQLLQLRTKQSATLYRLLWASIYTLDAHHAPETRDDHHDHEDAPAIGRKAIAHVHALLGAALELARTVPRAPPGAPADARVLGVSPRFFRRLLYCHSLPAAPSRRMPPLPPATRPPWALLDRSLGLILDHRAHDARCGPQPPPAMGNTRRLLHRSSLIIHLVRAALLGGSDERVPGEGTPETRLGALLEWLDRLDAQTGERVDRRAVHAAAKVVTKREFKGEVWSQRRDGLRGMTREWARDEPLERCRGLAKGAAATPPQPSAAA